MSVPRPYRSEIVQLRRDLGRLAEVVEGFMEPFETVGNEAARNKLVDLRLEVRRIRQAAETPKNE